MTSQTSVTDNDADRWQAFLARDRGADGLFVTGVTTTGIYCRASCPARRPSRARVEFFVDGAEARRHGYRACLRCRPDEAARDSEAVAEAARMIDAALAGDAPVPALAELGAATGYSPAHLQRLFARAIGLSPAAYARSRRRETALAALSEGEGVTGALHDAGYGAPSRFYDAIEGRLGMTASVWANGGRGVTIRWAVVPTSLGDLLVAATDKGVCRVTFGESGADLAARFPAADCRPGDAAFAALAARVVAVVEAPGEGHDIPLDVRGTAFQEAVWRALAQIPAGETRSYAELAAAAGHPRAVRAAGSANGANPVAVLVPCHRVVRADGGLGGYAWGTEVKAALLERESHTKE